MTKIIISFGVLMSSVSLFGMKPIEDVRRNIPIVSIPVSQLTDGSAILEKEMKESELKFAQLKGQMEATVMYISQRKVEPIKIEPPKPIDVSKYFHSTDPHPQPTKKLEDCSEECIQMEILRHERKERSLEIKLKEEELQKAKMQEEISNLKKMLEEMTRVKAISESESSYEKQKRIDAEREREEQKAKALLLEQQRIKEEQRRILIEKERFETERKDKIDWFNQVK